MAHPPDPIRFAAVGLAHPHIFSMVGLLQGAGAQLAAFHGDAAVMDGFGKLFPSGRAAADPAEIFEDETIDLVLTADVPDRRAAIARAALEHGKACLIDKPAAVTRDELAELDAVRRRTKRPCAIFFSERLLGRATHRAEALVRAGAIGEVVETIGTGPHQLSLTPRPDWFFDPRRSAGILGDLASHQMDQFLAFTASTDAQVVAAHVANRAHPEHPAFEDYGHALVRSERGTGYVRVDWYTPDGLGTWGDVRLTILGTEGTIEVRKNVDPAGRPGAEHLWLVDAKETRHIHCANDPVPFAGEWLADVRDGTETAQDAGLAFRAQALALEAQERATRSDFSDR